MKILKRENSFGKRVIKKEFSSKSRKYFDADIFDKLKNSNSDDDSYDERVLSKFEDSSKSLYKMLLGVFPSEDNRTLDDNILNDAPEKNGEKYKNQSDLEFSELSRKEIVIDEQSISAEELFVKNKASRQVGEKSEVVKNTVDIKSKENAKGVAAFFKSKPKNADAAAGKNSKSGIRFVSLPALLIGIIIFLSIFVFVLIVMTITLMMQSPFWEQDTFSLAQVCKMEESYYQNEIINKAAPLMDESGDGWSYPVILNDDINWRNTISVYYAYIVDKSLEDSTDKLNMSGSDFHYFEEAFWACNNICVEYNSTFSLSEEFDFLYLIPDSTNYSTITFDKGFLVLCYHPDPYVAAAALNFTEAEYEALDDYLSSTYDDSFELLLDQIRSGTGVGMVDVAMPEVGNGWEKYCNWFTGSNYRFEWCAAFVSWCADQNGYIDSGIIPKDSWVKGYYEWFSNDNNPGSFLYVYNNAVPPGSVIPQPGWLILWEYDNDHTTLNHIGIVESYDPATNYITTIEGNASDRVSRYTNHRLWDSTVWGFCIPAYPESIDYTVTNQETIQLMLNVDSSYIPYSGNFETAAEALADSSIPSDMLAAGEEIIELLEEGVVIPNEVFEWYNSNDSAGMYDLYVDTYGTPTPTSIP